MVIATLAAVLSPASGGDAAARAPLRTIWRLDGRPVLDYRSTGDMYYVLVPAWDLAG